LLFFLLVAAPGINCVAVPAGPFAGENPLQARASCFKVSAQPDISSHVLTVYAPSVGFTGSIAQPLAIHIAPFAPIRSTMMDVTSDPSGKSVLQYLKDMQERARLAHRHDLVRLYEEAWERAADAVHGPLPPRIPAQPLSPPMWVHEPFKHVGRRAEMLKWPMRKIVARVTTTEKDNGQVFHFDSEKLDCGHIVSAGPQYSESGKPAKHRRCRECGAEAEAAKKPPAPATKARGKSASA
jgi:hypothetical protein